MNAQLLEPAVRELFDRFKGEHRCKIEVGFSIDTNGDKNSSAIIFVGRGDDLQIFTAGTCAEAVIRAKTEYKPVDKARVEAARKLRDLADAIASGEAPIPE